MINYSIIQLINSILATSQYAERYKGEPTTDTLACILNELLQKFDKDKGISHTKYFIGSNYNFTKDDIKRAYIGNIRGRGYSVWDLHLELKNEDIVHPETSIKGEKLLKEHIKEVWHINIYNEYKNEWEYWDEEAVE